MEARAAILDQPSGPFLLDTVEVAEPRPGEVRVAVKAVGICHTDLILASGALGNGFPVVLGHEGAGVVEAVGDGVTAVQPGDKVLMSFNSCGDCPRCTSNDPAYCHEFFPRNMTCTRPDGSSRLSRHGNSVADNCFGQSSFATLAVANERNVLKLSDDADLALLAPLGCGVQTGVGAVIRSLGASAGESLLIIGAGAVGLSAVMGGRIAQCNPIIVVEPHEARRAMALELGATQAIDPAGSEGFVEQVQKLLPAGVNLILDTSGHMSTLERTPEMIAPLGRIGLVGVPHALDAALSVPMITWLTKGGTVRGIVEGDSDIHGFLPELIAHHAAGRLPIEKIITQYPFDRINEAIADSLEGRAIKPVLLLD